MYLRTVRLRVLVCTSIQKTRMTWITENVVPFHHCFIRYILAVTDYWIKYGFSDLRKNFIVLLNTKQVLLYSLIKRKI